MLFRRFSGGDRAWRTQGRRCPAALDEISLARIARRWRKHVEFEQDELCKVMILGSWHFTRRRRATPNRGGVAACRNPRLLSSVAGLLKGNPSMGLLHTRHGVLIYGGLEYLY